MRRPGLGTLSVATVVSFVLNGREELAIRVPKGDSFKVGDDTISMENLWANQELEEVEVRSVSQTPPLHSYLDRRGLMKITFTDWEGELVSAFKNDDGSWDLPSGYDYARYADDLPILESEEDWYHG